MSRNFVSVIGYVAALAFFTASPVLTAQFGTADEAKAMLERAVAAVKEEQGEGARHVQQGRRRV